MKGRGNRPIERRGVDKYRCEIRSASSKARHLRLKARSASAAGSSERINKEGKPLKHEFELESPRVVSLFITSSIL